MVILKYIVFQALLSNSWKAQALFKKIEVRANLKEYKKNKACSANRVLISGAGPAGLIMAVECQLLGAKVVSISVTPHEEEFCYMLICLLRLPYIINLICMRN